MNDERMRDDGMSEEFQARMRRGLSSMAVRERVRERSRNRVIAGGAMAAVIVGTAAALGVQGLAGGGAERDQAAPPTPEPTIQAMTPAPEPSGFGPTPPPGFEGVAAGEAIVTDREECTEGCGGAGAGAMGDTPALYDVAVLCEGAGSVTLEGEPWFDCAGVAPGTGIVQIALPVPSADPEPGFAASDDFTGQLQVVEHGEPLVGDAGGTTASVSYSCSTWGDDESLTVGGTLLDCADPAGDRLQLAAWGIPIPAGQLAPAIEAAEGFSGRLEFVVER